MKKEIPTMPFNYGLWGGDSLDGETSVAYGQSEKDRELTFEKSTAPISCVSSLPKTYNT
jgi:hypothetical protein